MAGLRASFGRLQRMRDQFEQRLRAAAREAPQVSSDDPSRLRAVGNFGRNPGNLRMLAYVPDDVGPSPPLVVALHGCTQTAAAYDRGTGWSELADRFGFAVIYPEQQPSNNPKRCFSWFLPGDTARDSGETSSIRQMIEKAVVEFGVDQTRIFVTGLSAGGAMASVMLATYPEVFAGGAIIAGLPFGCASSVQEAFEAMFNESAPSKRALGDRVRAASRHRGPWPTISVWHGSADSVVKPSNAEHIVRQWLNVQGLADRPSVEQIGPHTRRVWRGADGEPQLEAFSIAGMAHGVPLATAGVDSCGVVGPFFVDVGLSSTRHIARFWQVDTPPARKRELEIGLAVNRAPDLNKPVAGGYGETPAMHARLHTDALCSADLAVDPGAVIVAAFKAAGLPTPHQVGQSGVVDPGSIIEAALKAAGLRRG